MQDDAIRAARVHPAFLPVTGLKCSFGEISSPLTETSVGKRPRSREPSQPTLSYEDIENFAKELVVRLGNRARVKKS